MTHKNLNKEGLENKGDGGKEEKLRYPGLFNPLSRRFQVLLLIMIGYFSLVYMRTNLGLAMTCMINSTALALESLNGTESMSLMGQQLNDENMTILELPPVVNGLNSSGGNCKVLKTNKQQVINDYGGSIVWDKKTQGLLYSASFYGALLSLIPAGILADCFSPRLLLSFSALTSILCSATFPYLASLSWGSTAVFISMFLMGIGEGLILPAINKLVSAWIPTQELSRAASIYTTGNQLAGLLGFPISAMLCASSYKWPSIFYVCALIGIVWLVLWNFTITDTPQQCRYMMKSERAYLELNLRQNQPKRSQSKKKSEKIPYFQMVTSLPLWALIFCTFTSNMIVVLIQVYLPLFFQEVLFLSMVGNGVFSAAPNVSQFLVKMGWSVIMDKLKENKLSSNAACKISQGFSSFSVGILFIVLAYVGRCDQPYLSLGLLCAITMCFSTAISGFYTSLLSLAPLYTGTLTSIVMLSGYLGRLVTPKLVPFFNKTGTMQEWRLIFYSMAITTVMSGVFFLAFGSGIAQKWGLPSARPSLPEIKIDDDEEKLGDLDDGLNEEEMEALRELRRSSHVGSVVLDLLD